jgi:hypothetical protein
VDKIGEIEANQQLYMSALFLRLEKLAAKGALFGFLVAVGNNRRVASDEGIQ